MIDEELLRDLAHGPTVAPRPVGRITGRATVLRRRRRAGVVAGVALVAVLAAGVPAAVSHGIDRDTGPAVPTVVPTPRPSAFTAGPTDSTQCDGGQGSFLTPAQAEPVRYLPTGPAYAHVRVQPGWWRTNCPQGVRSAWYTTGPDGLVERSLVVNGWPSVQAAGLDPCLRLEDGVTDGAPPTGLRVRGMPGSLVQDDHSSCLSWISADGRVWSATLFGSADRRAALSAVESLRVRGGRVDRTQAPAGFDRAVPADGTGVPPTKYLTLETMNQTVRWVLKVRRTGETAPDVRPGQRPVDVRGRAGWLATGRRPADDITAAQAQAGKRRTVRESAITWSPADGVTATLTGEGGPDAALRIARATVKVGADDPRIFDFRPGHH